MNNPSKGLGRPWEFQEVEAPRFQDSLHIKVVSLSTLRTGRLYSTWNITSTHFCYRLSRHQGHSAAGRIMSMKNSNDFLVCSAVSQPATPKYCTSVSVFLPYLSGMPIGSLLLHITLSCVACLSVPYLSTWYYKRHDFCKYIYIYIYIFNVKWLIWFSLQLLSETFLVLRRIHGGTIVTIHMSSCKVPVIPVRF
jgi:hypothetical protein